MALQNMIIFYSPTSGRQIKQNSKYENKRKNTT